jgi:hypothetical protein
MAGPNADQLIALGLTPKKNARGIRIIDPEGMSDSRFDEVVWSRIVPINARTLSGVIGRLGVEDSGIGTAGSVRIRHSIRFAGRRW